MYMHLMIACTHMYANLLTFVTYTLQEVDEYCTLYVHVHHIHDFVYIHVRICHVMFIFLHDVSMLFSYWSVCLSGPLVHEVTY